MPYTRLCEKDVARHRDPEKRFKIVRAQLREMLPGRLCTGQKMLIETLVPLYLEILEKREDYGRRGFNMKEYMELQERFQKGLTALVRIEPRGYRRVKSDGDGKVSVVAALKSGESKPKAAPSVGFLEGLFDA